MHWRFSRPQDTDAVRPQVSDGPRLVASPAKGVRHRAGSRLAWEADGQSLHFANGPDIQNNEGVFLRVPDHPALSGHDKEGQGFSSLTVSARVRLDSLGHHQCLVRQTQFATEVGYLLSVSASGRVRFAVGTWSGKASVDSGNALLETGRWYDVAGLWHNGDLSVTIDGKPIWAVRWATSRPRLGSARWIAAMAARANSLMALCNRLRSRERPTPPQLEERTCSPMPTSPLGVRPCAACGPAHQSNGTPQPAASRF
jgi:hypothetical protein